MSRTRSVLLSALACLASAAALLVPAPAAQAATVPAVVLQNIPVQLTDRVQLSWPVPADGGSPLLSFTVYQATVAGGPQTLVATLPPDAVRYVIPAASLPAAPGTRSFVVRAVNAVGEGLGSGRVTGLSGTDYPIVRRRADGTGELDLAPPGVLGGPSGFPGWVELDVQGDHVGLAMTRDAVRLAFGVRATAAADLDLYTMRTDGSAPRTLLVGEPGVQESDPTWAPDGSAVVYVRGTGAAAALWRVPVSAGAPSGPAAPVPGGAGLVDPDWSPAGGFVVARPATGGGALVRLDLTTGARTTVPGTAGAVAHGVSPRAEAVTVLASSTTAGIGCVKTVPLQGTATPVDQGCYTLPADASTTVVWDPDGASASVVVLSPTSTQRIDLNGGLGDVTRVLGVSLTSQPPAFGRRNATHRPTVGMLFSTPLTGQHASVPFTMPLQPDGTRVPATCALDGAAPVPCSTPFTAFVAAGIHFVAVGAAGVAPVQRSWTSRPETRPTDRTGDGRPDLLAQDATGKVWLYPSTATGFAARRAFAGTDTTVKLLDGYTQLYPDPVPEILTRTTNSRIDALSFGGTGFTLTLVSLSWASNVVTASVGDFDADGTYDLVTRDSAGALWLYPGTTRGGVTGLIEYPTRRQIGTGWGGFTRLLGPGDFNGDRRADLIAVDAAGTAWLYPGNGSGGFLARSRIAGGWQSFTAVTAPGDWDRDGNADLLVRTSNGQLWVYPGTGTGTFKPRRLLPGAWGPFIALVS